MIGKLGVGAKDEDIFHPGIGGNSIVVYSGQRLQRETTRSHGAEFDRETWLSFGRSECDRGYCKGVGA